MNIRAVLNGLISSGIAIGLLLVIIRWAESQFPQIQAIRDTKLTLILFGGMIIDWCRYLTFQYAQKRN